MKKTTHHDYLTSYKTVSLGFDIDLPILTINHPFGKASLSLFGAHLLQFTPSSDNRQRLWVSPNTRKDLSKPIRGGIPICWPWFGDLYAPKLTNKTSEEIIKHPAHGFVRDQQWSITKVVEDPLVTEVHLKPAMLGLFDYDDSLDVTLVLTVGAHCRLDLLSNNESTRPIPLSCALHSYFQVNDIGQTRVMGIEGQYQDKTRDMATMKTPSPYFFSEETDRVHKSTASTVYIQTSAFTTQIDQQGHDSLVVWNPWQKKSKSMADMPDDGYKQMLCIEAAVTQGKILGVGETHTLTQIIY